MYYTYGQRQGLGIGGGHGKKEAPWYVSDKIIDENRLVVVQGQDHPSLFHTHVKASNVNWISGDAPDEDLSITAKIRYRSNDTPCKLEHDSKNTFIEFENPKFAIAPGQSIVFYNGDTCIGGGYIETRSNKNIS